jgi:MerR family transcriptional regulator/heat shock protein HspR
MMRYYTRQEVLQLLSIDEGFLLALEEEEIVARDAGPSADAEFSERMLERIRVAHNLTRDLDVNLPGVAVIVRLREELAEMQRRVQELLDDLKRR